MSCFRCSDVSLTWISKCGLSISIPEENNGLFQFNQAFLRSVFRQWVVRYIFFWTISSIFNWRFINLPLIWLMWKSHQHLKKDWSLVECDFQGHRYFHGNDIPKNLKPVKHEFCTSQICYRKADAGQLLKLRCMASEICRQERLKTVYVWFRIISETFQTILFVDFE